MDSLKAAIMIRDDEELRDSFLTLFPDGDFIQDMPMEDFEKLCIDFVEAAKDIEM